MPIKDSVKPGDLEGLRSKILGAKPSEEGLYDIMTAVKTHLNQAGHARYEQTINEARDVGLHYPKCIVFLIRGVFKVGGTIINGDGLGYPIEDEGSLQLEKNTAVVIIRTN